MTTEASSTMSIAEQIVRRAIQAAGDLEPQEDDRRRPIYHLDHTIEGERCLATAINKVLAPLVVALETILDLYAEPREDVRDGVDGPKPNDWMAVATLCREALQATGRPR